MTYFNLAGSHAGQQAEGPGSFYVTLLDTLYSLTADDLPALPHSETLHVG
nr:hypothetical protein [Halomonas stevensii]